MSLTNKLLKELMDEGAYKANSFVISFVLIACGFVMLLDHVGMSSSDIASFELLGVVLLSGGFICLGLQLFLLKATLSQGGKDE